MLSPDHRKQLLSIARASIEHGLRHGSALRPDLQALPAELHEPRATFVTLETKGSLRGCIGSLEPRLPLAADVAENAFQAAFHDPRFGPLSPRELPDLALFISVLSLTEPMRFQSEEDFLRQLRPGIDGIVLEEGWHRGTFLPVVWEQLPGKEDFVRHLKLKAGLPPDYWSDRITASRYTTEYFP